MKKLHLNKKESWRKEIFWLRLPFVTCQYPEGFCWLTSNPKPRVGKLKRDKFGNVLISTFFRGSKSIKNRYRFCTIKILRNPIGWLCNFGYNRTGFLPWECHRHPTEYEPVTQRWRALSNGPNVRRTECEVRDFWPIGLTQTAASAGWCHRPPKTVTDYRTVTENQAVSKK